MCERERIEEWNLGGGFDWTLNRRQFAIGGLGALTACASGPLASAGGASSKLAEDRVRVATRDGTMDAFFVRPAQGRQPGRHGPVSRD